MSRWRDTKKSKYQSKEIDLTIVNDEENNYARVLDKTKAYVTDSFMIVMPLMYLSIYAIMGGRESFEQNMMLGWLFILVPYLVIVVLFTIIKGQTPGYKAYEIKVVDNRTHNNLDIFTAILRFVLYILTLITILGIFVPLFRKDGKTLQDILASTAVIKYPNN
jgi:uncharacterized RDD family membrane protein YckC